MQWIGKLATKLCNPIPLSRIQRWWIHWILKRLQFRCAWQGQKNGQILATITVVIAQTLTQGMDQCLFNGLVAVTFGTGQQHLTSQSLSSIPTAEGVIIVRKQLQRFLQRLLDLHVHRC